MLVPFTDVVSQSRMFVATHWVSFLTTSATPPGTVIHFGYGCKCEVTEDINSVAAQLIAGQFLDDSS